MQNNPAQKAATTAKALAQQIAKQINDESSEILRTATSQVTGNEKVRSSESVQQAPRTPDEQTKLIAHQQELQDKMKASRMMEAFKRELDDIRKQDVFKSLQRKIAEGEQPPIEDYHELSMEQKQVLKAQMEAAIYQKKQAEYQRSLESKTLFSGAKKGRKQGGGGGKGQKGEMEKQQTRVEKPVPPSG